MLELSETGTDKQHAGGWVSGFVTDCGWGREFVEAWWLGRNAVLKGGTALKFQLIITFILIYR